MSRPASVRSRAGAVTSVLLAALCCAGPLVTGALGLAAAVGLFTRLEPLRPLFVVLAIALLVHAFVRAYRRPPAATGDVPVRRRRGLLWGSAVLCVALPNPAGSCCLGKVNAAIKQARLALNP